NVAAIACGHFHNLALLVDGTVQAWGKTNNGQCKVPAGLANVITIVGGGEHSSALKDDGTVVTWGNTNYFIPGGSPPPTTPAYIKPVTLAGSAFYNLYLLGNGKPMQYGYGTKSVPVSATNIVAVDTRSNFCLALNNAGQLIAWGTSAGTNIPAGLTNVFAMAAGLAHGIAIVGDGSPHILGPPAYNTLTSVGSRLPLFARVTGSGPLNYQWIADGLSIDQGTNAMPNWTVPMQTLTTYQFYVSNSLGCMTSAPSQIAISPLNIWGQYNTDGQLSPPRAQGAPATVSVGPFHVLAMASNGVAFGWGRNWYGQATPPANATNLIALAPGGSHSLALTAGGRVIAWGKNTDGQTNVPAAATNVVAIAAGLDHSVALREDGSVLAWGNNDYGQTAVSFLANQVVSLAAGYYHTLALRADGRVTSWGLQTDTDVPPAATNIIAIAAGWGHNLALRNDHTLLAWGNNAFGQATIPTGATNIVAIAAGWYHSMAIRGDGSVLVWGKTMTNSFITNGPAANWAIRSIGTGEDYAAALYQASSPHFLGIPATLTAASGTRLFFVPNLQSSQPAIYQWYHNGVLLAGQTNLYLLVNGCQSADSGSYELAVNSQFGYVSNSVVIFQVGGTPAYISAVGAWGSDTDGQTEIPPGIINPIEIAAGNYHNLALQKDGTVVGWGKNWSGQTNVPSGLINIRHIAAGSDFSLALDSTGKVFAWNSTQNGRTNVPPEATNIIAIAAGRTHALALRSDGQVLAWGDNEFGQTNLPAGLSHVIDIAAGYHHSLALREDRTVVAWGSQYLVPAPATNIVAIAAGWEHNLALTGDGRVLAWGDNSYGQCNVPAKVVNPVAIQAGYGQSMAQLSDGTIVAWGRNCFGATNVPWALFNTARISCGEDHELAIVGTGPPQSTVTSLTPAIHTGGILTLHGIASGTAPLNLQWNHDGLPIANATNAYLQ
ncbi:MAG TPA: hypothetical protein VF607_16450, partial [Verrucomicrobiae bacterium]